MVGREKKIEIRLRQNNLYDSYMSYKLFRLIRNGESRGNRD